MRRLKGVSVKSLVPLFVIILAACGNPDDGAAPTSSVAETTPTTSAPDPDSTTTTTIGDLEMPADNDEVEGAALADLASRLGVSPEEITVVRVRQVDWPDASLGCPEEGMAYAQVVTPGFQVLLQVDGRAFDYHAGTEGEVFLCPSKEKDGGYDFVPPPGIDT